MKLDVKVSFRSKGKVNVADYARSLTPDGGGHIRAAGCLVQTGLKPLKERVIKDMLERLG